MHRIANWYKTYVKTLSTSLKWIALVALVIILLQELLFFHMRPLFPFAYELGTVLQRILLSLIAGIIIYSFTVHLPRINRKQSVSVIIHNAIFKINHLATSLVHTAYENANLRPPAKIGDLGEKDLLKIISRGNMRQQQMFRFDQITYQDVMELLVAVKSYFYEYYDLMVPYIDLLNIQTLTALNGISNTLSIIYNPVQLRNSRTIISPGIYANIMIDLNRWATQMIV